MKKILFGFILIIHVLYATTSTNKNQYLFRAITLNDIKYVKYWISKGANVNESVKFRNGRLFPLTTAVVVGNLKIVKYLVSHGANINIKNNFGLCPLILSTYKGNLPIVKYLISHGANINVTDNKGRTLLFYAQKWPKITKYLKQIGVK